MIETGRDRRLRCEWHKLEERLAGRNDIVCQPTAYNAAGLPVRYLVEYHIHSICGVEHPEHLGNHDCSNPPLFANRFLMQIVIPENYPSVEAPPVFHFLTKDENGNEIPHPWHPNIRFFGTFAGRVCINMADTYTDLAWGVERVATYLRYECYHAISEPPYPEDLQVAAWVIRQGEPNEWVYFTQNQQNTI